MKTAINTLNRQLNGLYQEERIERNAGRDDVANAASHRASEVRQAIKILNEASDGQIDDYREPVIEICSSVACFIKDWKDGDFQLPKLAQIHVRRMEEKLNECAEKYRVA